MSLSRTISDIDGDFIQKLQNFQPPLYFASLLKGFPLGIGYHLWVSKKLEWWATKLRKKFDDNFSRLDTIHQRDGQTNGHRVTAMTVLTHSIAR